MEKPVGKAIETLRKRRSRTHDDRTSHEAKKLCRIWSREEALLALKQLYLTAMEGTLERVVDKKSGEVSVQFNSSAASTATKAIEAANRMMGYQQPQEEDAPGAEGIEVTFLVDGTLAD